MVHFGEGAGEELPVLLLLPESPVLLVPVDLTPDLQVLSVQQYFPAAYSLVLEPLAHLQFPEIATESLGEHGVVSVLEPVLEPVLELESCPLPPLPIPPGGVALSLLGLQHVSASSP